MQYGKAMDDKKMMYDEMISSVKKITGEKLLELMDEATEFAYDGDVVEVQRTAKEALYRVDMATQTIFNILCEAYGKGSAKLNTDLHSDLRDKIQDNFCDKILLAIHMKQCYEKGVPEV